MLAAMALPSDRVASRGGVHESEPSSPTAPTMARRMRSAGSEKSALRVKSPGRISAVLTTSAGAPGCAAGEHPLGAGDDEIAAEHQIGFAGGDADGVDVVRRGGEAHVAVHGAALLGETGHVDHAAALALEMRRHAEDARRPSRRRCRRRR